MGFFSRSHCETTATTLLHTRRSFLGSSLAAATATITGLRSHAKDPVRALPAATADELVQPIAFVTSEHARYGKVRAIYNGAIRTNPKLIACCSSEAGVLQAVQRATEEKLAIAVKSGGHCFEGFCLNDD